MAEGRRLAAIMFTDIVGFTALTQSDEGQSLKVVERHNRLLRSIFPRFKGREVKTMGDSFLVEFDSALDAINCATEIQRFLHDYNVSSRDEWKVTLRIGIHLGDVERVGGDILGDAVNIASRVKPLAEPEGVCISQQVYDQVRNKIPQRLLKLEPQELRGVKFAVDVYRAVMPWERTAFEATQDDKNRIAVLPFHSMSPDPNDDYFADGITEELIDRLARVKQLKVIARTSVMSYKEQRKKASQIAKELEVGSLVEGSVRKVGNRVRVAVQLLNGGTEEQLWSSHYDGSLDDIFAVQSEIAKKVVGKLRVKLLHSEKKNLERKPTANMEAYNDYLRGRELFKEMSEPSLRQALGLYQRAAELDPSFAKAHAGVAECHQYLATLGYEHRDVMFRDAKASLIRALELDPDMAEAHASLAMLHYIEDDLPGTEVEARRALELDPSLPEPYYQLSELAGTRGEPEEMVRNAETAYRLDPIGPQYIWTLGRAYFMTGREQELQEFWRKTERMDPADTYRMMTAFYLFKGNIAKAREFHSRFEKLQPTDPWVVYMGGFIDATAGDGARALSAIRKIEGAQMGPLMYNYIAFVYHALGDFDSYFEYMNRALDESGIIPTMMMYSPLLARAREDPRYGRLVEKLRSQYGLAK